MHKFNSDRICFQLFVDGIFMGLLAGTGQSIKFHTLSGLLFILTADPAGHALGSIYLLSLSPEFYFGKGILKALDLHTRAKLRTTKKS